MRNVIRSIFILLCSSALLTACDKNFAKINTNPYATTDIDPALLFAGAQRTHIGTWQGEHTIVQHFLSPYNTGATKGFNFNEDVDANSTPKWGEYTSSIKNMYQALVLLGPDTDRKNLRSMIRIWMAQVFMGLVDNYGDVPYSEAGRAVTDAIFFPKYDDDAAIYEDLYKELKEAVADLNPSGDFVSADLFYGTNAQPSTRTASAADQVAKWKKLGNSLLLRLGMRYSKVNPTKAASIVAEAFNGGVMTSNADNAHVKLDGQSFIHGDNAALRNFSHFNYAAELFVDQLKNTGDPRAKFLVAAFTDPGSLTNEVNPDTTLANQFGAPAGITSDEIAAGAPYRGTRGTGLNYSQINVHTIASTAVPVFWVTYSQTALLLAEAAWRGWIPGGDAAAQDYYEKAIAADMEIYSLYPNTYPITNSEIAAYLAHPNVAWNSADALRLINTQYWVVNIKNGTEAFANYRRSGYPVLQPNPYITQPIRRLSYPDVEGLNNNANYVAASAAIGGDLLPSRVFWDIP